MLIIESRDRIADFHLENAKTALKASIAMLEQDQRLVEAGEATLEEAQAYALSRLRKFRYDDGEGYVAIIEDDGFMTMHPIHEHLDQTNIWDLQDAEGSYIARDAIDIGLTRGIGVNRYYFEHPITGEIDIKTSAVGRFAPWGWTLIVGVFEKSVDRAVNDMLRQAFIIVLSMSCLFLLLALAIGRSLSQPASALTEAMTSIAEGNLDTAIPFQSFDNEYGRMSRALAVFRDSGRRIVILQEEREEAQRAVEKERLETTTRLRDQFGEVLQASSRGDFTQRVATDLHDENLRALAQMLNRFIGTVEAGVSTVKEAMSSMSKGQPPTARADAFEGAFADMLENVAKTSEIIRRQAQHLEHNALHDSLTGLPNRRYFEFQLDQLAADADARKRVALLHVDLDRFKEINDTLGHAAGDEILKHTARSLREAARQEDFVARVGGDEFVVLCDHEVAEDIIDAVASDIVAALSCPFVVEGGIARFGASVGVAFGRKDDFELLKNADLALYTAKKNGRGQVCFFSERIQSEFVETKRIGDEILRGLDNEEFVPYFQPQVDAKTREIVGVEALARWRHPERGVLEPISFLAIAEELDVVGRIDAQIFKAALDSVRRLNGNGAGPIEKLSVNLSFNRLMDADLLAVLDDLGPIDHRLAFELLESIVFDDQGEQFLQQIDMLKARGVEIEIDDFGSGRASITGLLKIAPHRLKIDRELIAPIVAQESRRRLIEAIVEIARTLEIGVVAEGVETLEHADLLTNMHCETLQGYAFAKPLSENDLDLFMRSAAMPFASRPKRVWPIPA